MFKIDRILRVAILVLAVAFVYVVYGAIHQRVVVAGDQAPGFTITTDNGRAVSLPNFGGKLLVLNFWATWCHPCWDEHPTLTAAAQSSGSQVQFLGVVFQDEESKITDFLRARGWAYPTLVDEKGKTAIAYGIGGVPETFFLDRKGTIVAKFEGPMTPEIIQENLAKAMQ